MSQGPVNFGHLHPEDEAAHALIHAAEAEVIAKLKDGESAHVELYRDSKTKRLCAKISPPRIVVRG